MIICRLLYLFVVFLFSLKTLMFCVNNCFEYILDCLFFVMGKHKNETYFLCGIFQWRAQQTQGYKNYAIKNITICGKTLAFRETIIWRGFIYKFYEFISTILAKFQYLNYESFVSYLFIIHLSCDQVSLYQISNWPTNKYGLVCDLLWF